jgi:hypothetical protein
LPPDRAPTGDPLAGHAAQLLHRVETVDRPIALITDIAVHEDDLAWAAKRQAWVEAYGSMSVKTDRDLALSHLACDDVKERAAKERPGFIADFAGLAQVRTGIYEPDAALLREREALAVQDYAAEIGALLSPPYDGKPGDDGTRGEGLVIETCGVLII